MDNLLTVGFEAYHAELNRHRRYEIVVGRDLFEHRAVSIRYGRTSQGGREEHFAGPRADEIRTVIRDRLRCRLSAPRHIGVPYPVTVLSVASYFDASAWLPGDVMARFFLPA